MYCVQVDHSSSAISRLPVELLAAVLQHTQQNDRLSCCALVSRKWRQAANMATCVLTCTADVNSERFSSLSAWLNKSAYACTVQSINVQYTEGTYISSNSVRPVLQLPFHGLESLRSLKLPKCALEAVAAPADVVTSLRPAAAECSVSQTVAGLTHDTAAAVPAAPDGYTSLGALTALSNLGLSETLVDLFELSSCTRLQHLQLLRVSHPAAAADSPSVGADCSGEHTQYKPAELMSMLAQLTQLTFLDVSASGGLPEESEDTDPVLQLSFGSLQQLQGLRLAFSVHGQLQLVKLPTILTLLHWDFAEELTPQTALDMHKLTQLQELQIYFASHMDAALLSTLTQLTCLHLHHVQFDTIPAVSGLMATLLQLTKLEDLNLCGSLFAVLPAIEQYAAITASSRLVSLDLWECRFPQHVSRHVFAAGGSQMSLTSLVTDASLLSGDGAFRRLTSCCPALQQLEILDNQFDVFYRNLDISVSVSYATGQGSSAMPAPCLLSSRVMWLPEGL